MTTRPKRFNRWWCFGLVLLLAISGWCLPGGHELRITTVKDNQSVFVAPIDPGERFTIHYYHSVENAPIWEEHTIDEQGRIYIEEERYLKFGAGMGRMPGVGHMKMKGPYETIAEMHMPTGNFVLRIGSMEVNHTILWRNTRTHLSAIAPHEAVQFSGHRINLLQRWWRSFFPHGNTPATNPRIRT